MKKIIFILSLTLFLPVLKADTYFDWERVSVSELPTASDDTLNKVYVINDTYYVTTSTTTGGTATYITRNENLNGKTIYFDYETYFNNLNNYTYTGNFVTFSQGGVMQRNSDDLFISFPGWDYNNYGTTTVKFYDSMYCDSLEKWQQNHWACRSYVTVEKDLTVASITRRNHYYLFSTTPWGPPVTTYDWLEVNPDQVFAITENTIYVPTDNLSCYIFYDRFTLRGYYNKPNINDEVDYFDFFLDEHYNSVTGKEVISNDINCISNTTTNILYRNDIVHILVFFVIVFFFVVIIPVKILFRFFRRFN